MNLLFITCVFGATILIEGFPNNFEIWSQPRSISDFPFLSWFYGNSTENIHAKDAPNLHNQQIDESDIEDIHEKYIPNSPQQQIDESNSDKLKWKKNEKVYQLITEPDPADETEFNHRHEFMETNLKEFGQETNDKWKSKDANVNDNKITVIAVDKIEPNEKIEPIENLFQSLKHEMNETSEEQKKNIAILLTDLNETIKKTSTNLAKVFINEVWHVFDIGALGTTRRTRNLDETTSLLAPIYALLGLFSQWLGVMHPGGNNVLSSNAHTGNNAQIGGLFELMFPFLSNSQSGVNQKVLGAIAGLPGGQKHDPSKNVLVLYIDDENKKEANRLFYGKTPDAILSRIKKFLDKNSLSEVEQFYIILKLYEMFDRLSGKNYDTTLKILKLIILISNDPRFQQLFKLIKSKNEPEFDDIWKLFKYKPKLNDIYLTILRNRMNGKMAENDCFIIGSDDRKFETDDNSGDKDSDSDDEDNRLKHMRKANRETYLMKIATRELESEKDYYICCLDDDVELKAKRILDGKTNDEIMENIKKKIERDNLSTEYKWYIILRLYNMLKEIEIDDKKDDSDEKNKNNKDDKEKIIKLIIVIGKNPKFESFIKEIKAKDDPRFNEIWKLLKNEPKEKKIEDKPSKKDNEDHKKVPKILSDVVAVTSPNVKKKLIKDNDMPKKDTELVPKVEPTFSAPPEISPWILKTNLSDILTLNQTTWENEFDPILRHIETKMKDPELGQDSRWNILDILDRWYSGKFVPEPKLSLVKSKADRLVNLVNEDPKYNEIFDRIKQENPPLITQRVFNLFGKEFQKPVTDYYSQTKFYTFSQNSSNPTAAQQETKLADLNPVTAHYFTDRFNYNNRKDFDNLDNVFLAQRYLNEQEIRKIREFIDHQGNM